MKYVVRYETVRARAADLASVYPRHKAYLDAFEPASDVIAIGTFDDPVSNGSMAIFASLDAAQRFVASDPFVVEGLVRPSDPLRWNAQQPGYWSRHMTLSAATGDVSSR